MKTLHCSDLGGPAECIKEISGETFEEMGANCKTHVMDMLAKNDPAHMEAVERMKGLSSDDQHKEFAEYQKRFEAAPEVE